MKILALDPSLTCTGYAVLDGSRVIDGGRIRPTSPASTPAAERAREIAREALDVVRSHAPVDVAVVETPAPQAPDDRNRRGQADYGLCVGVIIGRLDAIAGLEVVTARADAWTGGVSKAKRAAAIAAVHPEYNPDRDGGMDVADAIGLADWWLDHARINAATRGG